MVSVEEILASMGNGSQVGSMVGNHHILAEVRGKKRGEIRRCKNRLTATWERM